jgi:hypothetical protein
METPPCHAVPTEPCELCGEKPGGTGDKELVVDHDCQTGVVYGVLCVCCKELLDNTEWYHWKRQSIMDDAEAALLRDWHGIDDEPDEPELMPDGTKPQLVILGPPPPEGKA